MPDQASQPETLFLSDTSIPVQEIYLKAILETNQTPCAAYGNDPYTARLRDYVKTQCGQRAQTFLVPSGTGGYRFAMQMCGSPDRVRIITTSDEHLARVGANATPYFKQLASSDSGLMSQTLLQSEILEKNWGQPHVPRAGMVHLGVMSPFHRNLAATEIQKIVETAHGNNLFVVVDAARGYNSGLDLKTLADAGVDVICWGGTKQGMLNAEMVVFTNDFFRNYPVFHHIRGSNMELDGSFFASDAMTTLKSSGMLQTKWAPAANQLLTSFEEGAGFDLAVHANRMAELLAERITREIGYEIAAPVESNAVFVTMPTQDAEALKRYYPYLARKSNKPGCVAVRLMTSPQVNMQDIDRLVSFLSQIKANSSGAISPG